MDPALAGGLGRSGLITLAAIIATVPLLVANVLPDYVVMLFLTLALGRTRPRVARGHPRRLRRSRLAHGLHAARGGRGSGPLGAHVPAGAPVAPATAAAFVPQSVVLCLTGVVMTAGLSSGSTRIALGVPIARGITDAMGFAPRSPGSAAVGLMTFFTFLEMGELFQTGTFTGLIVHDLLRGRQGPDHLVALVLHRAAAVRRHRCRDVPGAALPLQAAQDGAGQPGSGAAPAGAPPSSHAKRDLERGGAASPHRRVRHPAVPRNRPGVAVPDLRSSSCSRSACSTSRPSRAAGRSGFSSTG